MLILPERGTPRGKLLLPMRPTEWRQPSQRTSVFGLENVTVFRLTAFRRDGTIAWRGRFDDREDADAFLFAMANDSLQYECELWRLPTPWWHPDLGESLLYSFDSITFLTTTSGSSQTYSVPFDFNSAKNGIEAIGGGGGGGGGVLAGAGTGGGGGEYRKVANLALTPGGTAPFTLKAGASGQTAGQDVTFNTSSVVAKGGGAGNASGSSDTGGAGGTGGTGAAAHADGGTGGNTSAGLNQGGGGGGAGGPNGVGGAGGAGGAGSNNGSGGGGGNGGGSAGGSSSTLTGGNGGNNVGGTGGGAGQLSGTPGSNGTNGGGGGGTGGLGGAVGGNGGSGIDLGDLTKGGGGGGAGGARGTAAGAGGTAGNYGGGGGGAGLNGGGGDGVGGGGAQGIIVVTYTPFSFIAAFNDETQKAADRLVVEINRPLPVSYH